MQPLVIIGQQPQGKIGAQVNVPPEMAELVIALLEKIKFHLLTREAKREETVNKIVPPPVSGLPPDLRA